MLFTYFSGINIPLKKAVNGAAIIGGTQLLRVMKILAIILTTCAIHASAHSSAQVTYSASNQPLDVVFKQVGKQTGYSFLYKVEDLSGTKKVSIQVSNVSMDVFMKKCLEGQPLEYSIEGKSIFVSKSKSKKQDGSLDASVIKFQSIEVLVRVKNEEGDPVAGVTVMIKGTKIAAATNGDGICIIKAEPQATLLLTAVNIQSIEAEVRGRKEIDVRVNGKTAKLDEVQVIGYGNTSQRLSTGNVVTVKSSEISKQPVTNPLLALQGRVPGLFITQQSGFANSGITVRIQGKNSLLQGNDPFYVIDGVPFQPQASFAVSAILGSNTGAHPLSFINPSEIESIDILKDADATAIYGSRAANGAILITTKKGKSGESKVNFNVQTGIGKVSKKIDLLSTAQYLEMRKQAYINDGLSIPNNMSSPDMSNYDLTVWDQQKYTDWQKELIGGNAKYNDIQSNFSGGNNNVQYLIGAGFHNETTVFPSDVDDTKASVHFNLNTISTNQKFRVQLAGNFMYDNNKLMLDDLTGFAMQTAPNAPSLYNADGSLNWAQDVNGNSTWYNPLVTFEKKYTIKTKNLLSNAVLSYDISPELQLSSSFGYNNIESNELLLIPLTANPPEIQPFESRSARYGANSNSSWIIEPKVNYKKTILRGRLDLLVGLTFNENTAKGSQVEGFGYSSDLVMEDIKAAPFLYYINAYSSTYKYNAVYGRVNYNYSDKYILNLSARRDGSSRFGSANKFHNFGAIGFAWLFTNEMFFREKIRFLSFGKLRGSYGTTGSDQIGDYKYLNNYNFQPSAILYQGGTNLEIEGLTNPHLKWETTKKMQFGLDIGLFKEKVLLNCNYYRNRSSDQLLSYRLPIVTGYNSILRNFPAVVQNSGWEISLSTINIKKGRISWTSSLNITVPKNELISFENLDKTTLEKALVVGKPITILAVYQLTGVNASSGLYEFRTGGGTLTSKPNALTDRLSWINTSPRYYGGIQNTVRFGGWEVDFLFQYVKKLGRNNNFGSFPGYAGQNQPIQVLNAWKKPGDQAPIQKYSTKNSSVSIPFNAARSGSDASWSDASFIRLKNVAISWTLPKSLQKRIFAKDCRLYVHGQNLFTITGYKGLDPETASSIALPPLRVVTFGIQFTL